MKEKENKPQNTENGQRAKHLMNIFSGNPDNTALEHSTIIFFLQIKTLDFREFNNCALNQRQNMDSYLGLYCDQTSIFLFLLQCHITVPQKEEKQLSSLLL